MSSSASSRCQTGGGEQASVRLPWTGDGRADDKTELFKYAVSEPNGVPLSKVVRDVFGASAVDKAGGDYQLARRFFRDVSAFQIDRRGGYLWVEPRVGAFNLRRQYANAKTTGRRRGGMSNGDNSGETVGDIGGEDCRASQSGRTVQQYPKDRAKSILEKRLILDGSTGGHDYRGELLRELGTERVIQSDKFDILRRRVRGQGGHDYLLIPHTTRFNSERRAASNRDGFTQALETASGRHHEAVVMTLSTDTNRFESVSEAMSNLMDAKGRLMSWLSTEYQIGHRPENLSVVEFTEAGVPHVHVVLFGVGWAVHQRALSAKWDSLGQGRVVDIRRTMSRGDSWILHNDDGGTVTVREYLGKAIRGLCRIAAMDDGDLKAAAEAGNVEYWRHALYWATGRQYYSCSGSLKATDDGEGDGLPAVVVYEFVGVAEYSQIPAHVRESAIVVQRDSPPPD